MREGEWKEKNNKKRRNGREAQREGTVGMGGRQVRKRDREKNYTAGDIELKGTGSRDRFKFFD